jgi:hypothetical protein
MRFLERDSNHFAARAKQIHSSPVTTNGKSSDRPFLVEVISLQALHAKRPWELGLHKRKKATQ